MYLHICTNERHKCCILSMQQPEITISLLHHDLEFRKIYNLIVGTLGCTSKFCDSCLAIYPVAYGVGFTLQGLPIVTWISNFKQQTIVGGQYFNVPKPTEFCLFLIKLNCYRS